MENSPHTSVEKQAALSKILHDHPGVRNAQQRLRLRLALSKFPISTHEARLFLDVYSAPPRVRELRLQGDCIVTSFARVTLETGIEHRLGVYGLQTPTGFQP